MLDEFKLKRNWVDVLAARQGNDVFATSVCRKLVNTWRCMEVEGLYNIAKDLASKNVPVHYPINTGLRSSSKFLTSNRSLVLQSRKYGKVHTLPLYDAALGIAGKTSSDKFSTTGSMVASRHG